MSRYICEPGSIADRIGKGLLLVFLVFATSRNMHAETRLFVPDFQFGGGADTQLLINNKASLDAAVDIWGFLEAGEFLGQAQVRVKAHSTRTATLQELFGNSPKTRKGWLAVIGSSDGIEVSYTLAADNIVSPPREGAPLPAHQFNLVMASAEHTLRVSNVSSEPNTLTLRQMDASGKQVRINEVTVAPFAQAELPIQGAKLELTGSADFLATPALTGGRAAVVRIPPTSEEILAVVIDSNIAVGAYQLLVKFDPKLAQISTDDVEGGTASGFQSKPLAVVVDNVTGQLRLAAFQVGEAPAGQVHVATIHIRKPTRADVRLSMSVEEITDIKGGSILKTVPDVRLIRITPNRLP